MTRVDIIGGPLTGSGYPQPTLGVAGLLAERTMTVADHSTPVAADGGHWRGSRLLRGSLLMARLGWSACASVARWLLRGSRDAVAYVPYPAVPTLVLLSLLPRKLRPRRIVGDAFVSWYDTATGDRGLLRRSGWPARMLRYLESRAFACADRMVTDTEANARCYAELLALPAERFAAAPLFTMPVSAVPVRDRTASEPLRVVFVGTFVPLHGLETIALALRSLPPDTPVQATVLGDGQEAQEFARLTAGLPASRLVWRRGHHPWSEVERAVAAADACLGVFGTGKAARVWPLKNYLYFAVGRAVVTSNQFSTPDPLSRDAVAAAAMLVPPADPEALAAALTALAREPELPQRLGLAARRCYEQHLAPGQARSRLAALLAETAA